MLTSLLYRINLQKNKNIVDVRTKPLQSLLYKAESKYVYGLSNHHANEVIQFDISDKTSHLMQQRNKRE